MNRYSKYRDSHVKWGDEIPYEWEVIKLGSLLKNVSEKNHPSLPLLSITREQGVIIRDTEDDSDNHNFIPDDLSGYKLLKKGQFGMNKMKAWQGSYGVSPETGIVSPAYYVFDFSKPVEPNFFHFAIRSKLYVSYFGSASDGVRIGQWDLSKSRMKEIPFFLPSIKEQTAIANFLDEKTEKIDQAIAQKEKMIELLKERKQIMIQNAVTKGLDPNVKLVDSGVEWIGEIPEHWEVVKIKLVSQFVLDGTHGSFPRVEEGFRLLSVRNIIDDEFVFREDDSRVSLVHYREISSKFQISNGDIMLAIVGATLGKVAVVGELNELFVTQRSVATIRVADKKCINHFLAYFIRSKSFQSYLWNNAGFSAQPGVYLNTIQNAHFPLPPVPEQHRVIGWIENTMSSINQSITLQHTQIEKLKEYKATLIDSAITGKIKVC